MRGGKEVCNGSPLRRYAPAPQRGQRRRPPPAAETGRSCWGSGQQDARPAPRAEADAGSRNPGAKHLWRVGQVYAGRAKHDVAQKGGPCYRGQARLRTNLSVSLRSTAPLVGEPLAKPFTLRGLPKPPLLGATATTAASGGNREELLGQRPAGCERQRSRRWEPQPGSGIASAMTERLYEGKPDREPLQRPFTQVSGNTAAPRRGGLSCGVPLFTRYYVQNRTSQALRSWTFVRSWNIANDPNIANLAKFQYYTYLYQIFRTSQDVSPQ